MAVRMVLLASALISTSLLLSATPARAAGRGPVDPPQSPDVAKAMDSLRVLGHFSQFLRIFSASGLEAYLKTYVGTHASTVFAFTDEAYASLPPAKRLRVNSPPLFLKLVSLHIASQLLPGSVLAALPDFAVLPTLEGAPLVKFTSASRRPAIGVAGSRDASQTAVIVQTNVYASPALVVHACNNILLPP